MCEYKLYIVHTVYFNFYIFCFQFILVIFYICIVFYGQFYFFKYIYLVFINLHLFISVWGILVLQVKLQETFLNNCKNIFL